MVAYDCSARKGIGMLLEFCSFSDAAAYMWGSGVVRQGDDHNPILIMVAGKIYHACGPTTELWLEANGMEVAAIADGITFAS